MKALMDKGSNDGAEFPSSFRFSRRRTVSILYIIPVSYSIVFDCSICN